MFHSTLNYDKMRKIAKLREMFALIFTGKIYILVLKMYMNFLLTLFIYGIFQTLGIEELFCAKLRSNIFIDQ